MKKYLLNGLGRVQPPADTVDGEEDAEGDPFLEPEGA